MRKTTVLITALCCFFALTGGSLKFDSPKSEHYTSESSVVLTAEVKTDFVEKAEQKYSEVQNDGGIKAITK